MKLTIEFGGGLELLFGQVKKHEVDVVAEGGGSSGAAALDMRAVIRWMRDHLLKERPELFVSGDTVRPGILVLINEADWELEGGLKYAVQAGDVLTFISTLHGG